MNSTKLKCKIVDKRKNYQQCADVIGKTIQTFTSKINDCSPFYIDEAEKLGNFLEMTGQEKTDIFLSHYLLAEKFDERREMNELKIFENEEFGEVRTTEIDGKPYFCGGDVTRILGYKNPQKAIRDHCKGVNEIDTPTNGGIQKIKFISEGDLYRLIARSKLPSAERFEEWVFDEVLPTIRKTGSYQVPMTTEGQIQLLAKGHMELNEKIDNVANELNSFKKEMPLLAVECEEITRAKRKKVFDLVGGKNSKAYKDRSLISKIYKDMEKQLIREFDISTYKAIKRNQTNKALEIIRNYQLPLFLEELVKNTNAQMELEV